ncbi:excalibur domain-containing protein, partial [Candidatus Parcubacteria bacterium]|nr:excalibur domain-containing protein [Candidatus Parcubacteria bacterium]
MSNASADNIERQAIQDIKQNCHPSYSGCLNPDASDYDCAGGSGNGPYYTGKVRVIGPDVFGLD